MIYKQKVINNIEYYVLVIKHNSLLTLGRYSTTNTMAFVINQ